MATLCSSPMGPTARFELFEQPSSPKFYGQDDLPADFDKSFGSSMSISESFDGNHAPQFPSLSEPSQPYLFNPSFGLVQSLSNTQAKVGAASQNDALSIPRNSSQSRLCHRPGPTLGAAMGTTFNTRSPGLGARMSSPRDMDISPAPSMIKALSPTEALPQLMDSIHFGASQSKIPSQNLKYAASATNVAAARPSHTNLGSSIGSRLFGTEITLNSHPSLQRDQELLSSPDKEPPAKRRPNSLPTRQVDANRNAAHLSSILFGGTAPRTRPALLTTFSGQGQLSSGSSGSRREASIHPRHRLSDSTLPSSHPFQRRASRVGSAESFFEECQHGSDLDADEALHEEADSQHIADLNPSPSPSMSGAMADYFYDPMSPEKTNDKVTDLSHTGHNLLAAMTNVASSSASSPLGSSPCTRMPPPKRTTSLGLRTFERTHTTAALTRQSNASGPTASVRSSLGKRSNPYVKRPSLTNESRPTKSAYPVLGASGQTTKVIRPTAPAPRRCFSSFDHSSALSVENRSTAQVPPVSAASDVAASPERRRCPVRGYSEMADANGSPIAPGHRSRPSFLRKESKDDSSPLAYGTGMKRSGSRSGEMMADDLGLGDTSLGSSPASAESLPGFGASEREGKVLPCFNVKDDGLMRITAQTMTDLLAGKFTNAIASYQVVDCRFGYEYEGGHIPGAINLSTVDRVVNHFLKPGQGHHIGGRSLPPRSQSGKPDAYGNRLKHVLVFHCEFSCKRAPTMALALRQADRALVQDYPNCHFPEIYVLQGGYCDFFRTYANLCEPQQYICMDDPRYHAKRSTELNGFRKQFSRHRSFTYGEGKKQQSNCSSLGRKPSAQSIREEDSTHVDESPCPAGVSRLIPNPVDEHVHMPNGGISADGAASGVADTSFGSVGDSSFEDGIGDSPCAAAGFRKPTMILQPRMGSLGRRPLQRAETTAGIVRR